jgi:hypothetical protein
MNKRAFVLLIVFLVNACLFSLIIEYENTWKRYVSYSNDSVLIGDILYVNSQTALELYNISDDGSCILEEVIEFNRLIHGIEYVEEDNLLFILLRGQAIFSPEIIEIYSVEENLEYITTYDEEHYFYTQEWAFPVSDYVILGHNNTTHYYDKVTGEIENLTYYYREILGSFDDILVEYDGIYHQINFYRIEDINEPELIYQESLTLDVPSVGKIVKLFDNALYLMNRDQIMIYDYNEGCITERVNTIQLPITESVRNMLLYTDSLVFINTHQSDFLIYDFVDRYNPEFCFAWDEEDVSTKAVTITNGRFLFLSQSRGFFRIDLANLPEVNKEIISEFSYPLSNTFYNGMGYYNADGYFYRVNPATGIIDVVCDLPIEIGWRYYNDGNLICIFGGLSLGIVDIENDELLYHSQFDGTLLNFFRGIVCVQGSSDQIDFFYLNTENDLEHCGSCPISGTASVKTFSDQYAWISDQSGVRLLNTETLEIEYDYGFLFSSSPDTAPRPFVYDNRMLVVTGVDSNQRQIKLYNIDNFENPILLDSKVGLDPVAYYFMDNYILEARMGLPVHVYNKFEDGFEEAIDEVNFDTFVEILVVDEDNQRIGISSPYFLKTFLYEDTGIGLNLLPEKPDLVQVYPNPFNPEINIYYQLAETRKVIFEVYNIKGQKVQELINCRQEQGKHHLVWGANDITSGLYFLKCRIGEQTTVEKITLLK